MHTWDVHTWGVHTWDRHTWAVLGMSMQCTPVFLKNFLVSSSLVDIRPIWRETGQGTGKHGMGGNEIRQGVNYRASEPHRVPAADPTLHPSAPLRHQQPRPACGCHTGRTLHTVYRPSPTVSPCAPLPHAAKFGRPKPAEAPSPLPWPSAAAARPAWGCHTGQCLRPCPEAGGSSR